VYASTGDNGGTCDRFNAEGARAAAFPRRELSGDVAVGRRGRRHFAVHRTPTTNYVRELAWTSGRRGISSVEVAGLADGIVPSSAGGSGRTRHFDGRGLPAHRQAGDTVVGGSHGGYLGTACRRLLAMGAWARMETRAATRSASPAPVYYATRHDRWRVLDRDGLNDVTIGSNVYYQATPAGISRRARGSIDMDKVIRCAAAPAADCLPITPAPIAALQASPLSGNVAARVNFNASASSAPQDTIEYYVLDPGDGSDVIFSATPTFTHSYANPGAYTASLSVRTHTASSAKMPSLNDHGRGHCGSCSEAPGQEIITSPPGAADRWWSTSASVPTILLSVSVAEPPDLDNRLIFTIKVDNLNPQQPAFRWVRTSTSPRIPTTITTCRWTRRRARRRRSPRHAPVRCRPGTGRQLRAARQPRRGEHVQHRRHDHTRVRSDVDRLEPATS